MPEGTEGKLQIQTERRKTRDATVQLEREKDDACSVVQCSASGAERPFLSAWGVTLLLILPSAP